MSQYPILQTKLYIPPIRPDPSPPDGTSALRARLVSRPRLIKRLNQGLYRKLTLISAPAGYGKTTLVSEWVHAMGCATPPIAAAWLSLDGGDSDPTRFLTYFVAALQTLALRAGVPSGAEGPVLSGAEGTALRQSPAGKLGDGVLAVLQSPQAPPVETILTTLLNEIAAVPDNFVLVLDDYHLIEAKAVDASTSVDGALTFLLEHLPPQMHLVIATERIHSYPWPVSAPGAN